MGMPFSSILSPSGPVGVNSYGPAIDRNSYIARFRLQVGTVGVGDVLMMDVLSSDAGATTQDNAVTSVWGVLIAPSAGLIIGTAPGMVAVVTDLLSGAGADDTDVLACYYGPCTAFVIAASGSQTIDTPLVVTTAKNFDVVVATGERHFAQGAETITTPTSRTLGKVFLHNNAFPFGYSQAA
jgi:hypothetical protein